MKRISHGNITHATRVRSDLKQGGRLGSTHAIDRYNLSRSLPEYSVHKSQMPDEMGQGTQTLSRL